MAHSPTVIPYNGDAVEIDVQDGIALPANQSGFISVGYDGANLRFVRVNSSGQQVFVGAGTAGTPAGGVVSVQGVGGGTPVPVSGTFWQATQPVSVSSLPLPAGAATEATLAAVGSLLVTELDVALSTRASEATLSAIKDTDGVKKITDPLPAGTNEIGKVAQGTAAAATAPWPVRASDGTAFINVALEHVTAASPHAARLSDGSAFYDAAKTGQLPSALVGGRLDVNAGGWMGSTAPTVGQKTMASSLPVVIASDQSEVQVKQGTAAALSGAWPTKVTDGTNTMPTGDALARSIFQKISDGTYGPVAVKDASTSPVSADKALVVVLSPNQQPIPVSSSPATATSGLAFGSVTLGGGSSGSLNAVRGTTYNEQTSNAQRSIASASANDTSAGTGARTIKITYYTSAGLGPYEETVALNGTTPVNTVATNICFIEKMEVITVGSGGTNAGVVTLYVSTGGGGGTIGTIGVGNVVAAAGDNHTLWAHHYVPAGQTCSITGLAVGASAPSTFHLRSKTLTVANAADELLSGLITTTAAFQRTYGSPLLADGPARILAYAVPSTNGVTMNCSFDFFETATV